MLGDVQSAWRCAECLEMCKVLASVQSACRCAMCLKMCNVLEYVQTWRERVSSGCSHVVLVSVGFDRVTLVIPHHLMAIVREWSLQSKQY